MLNSYELVSKLEPNNLISKDKIIILTNLLNKPENLAVILLYMTLFICLVKIKFPHTYRSIVHQ